MDPTLSAHITTSLIVVMFIVAAWASLGRRLDETDADAETALGRLKTLTILTETIESRTKRMNDRADAEAEPILVSDDDMRVWISHDLFCNCRSCRSCWSGLLKDSVAMERQYMTAFDLADPIFDLAEPIVVRDEDRSPVAESDFASPFAAPKPSDAPIVVRDEDKPRKVSVRVRVGQPMHG